MRRKLIRHILVFVLTACVFMSGAFTLVTVPAEAKSTPKLSSKSVPLAMGGTQKIKLKNGSGKWSIKGTGVIRIKKKTKKYITVAPVKAGTATVYCKAGKKKLKCKVRVLNNSAGSVKDTGNAWVVGDSASTSFNLPEGVSLTGTEYDTSKAKVTTTTKADADSGETKVTVRIKALKPGKFYLKFNYMIGSKPGNETIAAVFIKGFRGKAKAKKTDANYKKWRKKIISSMVSEDMTTWEIIDAVGALISTGKYSMKGGTDGKQLWYGGNGTCVSGSMMMDDFMKDLGIRSKVRFAGKLRPSKDIFGYSVMYGTHHRNTLITIGGKRYELNPQPGMPWPVGIVNR